MEEEEVNVSSLLLTAGGNRSSLLGAAAVNASTRMDDVMDHPAVQVHIYALYAIIFVVGLLGNVLVVFVVANNKAMQTVTNCFIANLAMSDILLCVLAVPFTPLYFYLNEWTFGKILCHLVVYSQGTSVYVSTLTLTSIAIDRFFVILYPFRPRMRMTTCWITILAIWLVALCATLPYGIFVDLTTVNNRTYCEEKWTDESDRQIFGAVTTVMQFVVPFIIMAFAYTKVSIKLADRSREKAKIRLKSCRGEEADRERSRRTNRMLIAMVTIFGASWLPLNLVNLLNDLYAEPTSWWKYYNLCFFLAHTVAMSSTCYNVFLYAWLNDNFRKEFKRILPCFSSSSTPPSVAAAASAHHQAGAPGAAGGMMTANALNGGPGILMNNEAEGEGVMMVLPVGLDGHMASPERAGSVQQDSSSRDSAAGNRKKTAGGRHNGAILNVISVVQDPQILLPGEDGELVDEEDVAGMMTGTSSRRDQSAHHPVNVELIPMAYATTPSPGDEDDEERCPQCSSKSAKTSFMTFEELADVNHHHKPATD